MQKLTSQQTPFIIAGMHRSGTSLTAMLMQSAGVHIGRRLMPGTEYNPKGHFENLDFFEFHLEALRSQGVNQDGWTLQDNLEINEEFREKAQELVEQNALSTVWGWKEPRTTLFLEFWANFLPDAKFLLIYRSPWEVVDSLYRRQDPLFQSQPELAIKYWLHYNQKIIDFYNQYSHRALLTNIKTIVAYQSLYLDEINQKFNTHLHHPSPSVYDSSLFKTESSLDSHRPSLIDYYFPEAIEMYQELESRGWHPERNPDFSWQSLIKANPYREWAFQDWINVRKQELEAKSLRAELERHQVQLHEVQEELEQTQDQFLPTQAKLVQTQSELSQTESLLEKSQTQLHEAEDLLEQFQLQLQKTESVLQQSYDQLSQTRSELTQTKTELIQTHSQLQNTANELGLTQQKLAQSSWDAQKYQFQLHQTQEELEQVELQRGQLQGNLKQLQAKLYQAEMNLSQLLTELNKTQKNWQRSQAQLHQTQGHLEETQTQFQQSQAESQTHLEETQTQFQQSQAESQTHLEETQSRLEQSQTQLHQTQGELQQSLTQVNALRKELQQSQSELQENRRQLKRTESILHQTQGELAEAQQFKVQLEQSNLLLQQSQKQLEQTQARLRNSEAQFERTQDEFDRVQLQLWQTLEQLEQGNFQPSNTTSTTPSPNTQYKLLVFDGWRAYCNNDLTLMCQYLQQSLKHTTLSRTEVVTNWLESLGQISHQRGVAFDVSTLTNSPEWQQLMRRVMAVKPRNSQWSEELTTSV